MPFSYFLILLILSAIFVGLVLALARTIVYAIPMLNGPVFVPSADDKLKTMLELANPKNFF